MRTTVFKHENTRRQSQSADARRKASGDAISRAPAINDTGSGSGSRIVRRSEDLTNARIRAARRSRKIDNVLPGWGERGIVFFRNTDNPARCFPERRVTWLGANDEGDSLIAPQAIEMAQNGLANDHPKKDRAHRIDVSGQNPRGRKSRAKEHLSIEINRARKLVRRLRPSRKARASPQRTRAQVAPRVRPPARRP